MLKKLELQPETATTDRRPLPLAVVRAIAQFAIMVCILGASVYAMNWLVATTPERPRRPPFTTVYPIDAAEVRLADHRPTIRVFGQAVAARAVDLKALVGGEIIWVNPAVRAGARIAEGDKLLEIDRFDYEIALSEAQTNLAQTKAAVAEIDAKLATERDQLEIASEQLQLAEKDLERAQALAETGSVTQKFVEDRMLIVIQRRQAVNQRENNILVAEAQKAQQMVAIERLGWKVKQAERKLKDTVLRAPFDSVVRSTTAELGKTVSSSETLFAIYSADNLEARFTLTDAQYGRIVTDSDPLIGRLVSAIWTIGDVDHTFEGNVARVGSDIVSDRGGVEIFAALTTPETGVRMRPGAFLEISVTDRHYPNSARLPESAVYDSKTAYAVVDGKLEPRAVRVLAYDGAHVIIDGDIADGDMIMTTRLSEVGAGLAVSMESGS
ncbi:MAG: HlyD family efflux transporter periplasmic adaptor subunit [Rhizobiaceae bacterium]